jgi:hypothetical protein
MPDDTDNVSDNSAETSYRTNWFPDSLADNAQKRPLVLHGLSSGGIADDGASLLLVLIFVWDCLSLSGFVVKTHHATKAGCSGHDNKRRAIAGFARPYTFNDSPTVQTLGLFAFLTQ